MRILEGYDFDPLLPSAPSDLPSRASSFGQTSTEHCTSTPGLTPPLVATPEPCETWPSIVTVPEVAGRPVVASLSPSSSIGPPGDYAQSYTHTSAPTSAMCNRLVPPLSGIPPFGGNNVKYDDLHLGKERNPRPRTPVFLASNMCQRYRIKASRKPVYR